MPAQPRSASRRLRIGCEFQHELAWPVPIVLQVEPHPAGDAPVVAAHLNLDPASEISHFADPYGNVCARLTLPPGRSLLRFEAEVEVSGMADPVVADAVQHAVADLPDEALHFTLASRYCESDRLANTAWGLFGGVSGGWARTQAVCDWVHDNLTWMAGSSGPATAATDVYLQRRGVCRDFAQLAISFLRALNIPARYCFGYLPDLDIPVGAEPMDFAAWLEAYVGGAWHTFDPRNNVPRSGRVLVGRGRDALDVAMLTSYGDAPLLALRVCAEEATAIPWSSAVPPVFDLRQVGMA